MLALSTFVVSVVSAAIYVVGFVSAVHAAHKSRTSQGAIAWSMALLAVPFLSLPAYWVFGRSKYHGYVKARRHGAASIQRLATAIEEHAPEYRPEVPEGSCFRALERLVRLPVTKGNRSRLLIDGKQTFDAIFAGIAGAREYVLVQFYIVRDDHIGRRMRDALLAKAKEGVRCYFLFDEIGSASLPYDYVRSLREAGIRASPFRSTKGPANRFQFNFRNHRKVVVVDGRTAYVGGHNVGDEYLGEDPKLSPWRDTHVEVQGPAVQGVQLSFLEDWFWATQEDPELEWEPEIPDGGTEEVLVLPTGPADTFETCSCFFVEMASAAQRRLWIATPYLVPDSAVTTAIQLAALRGVDVRILIPSKRDQLLSWLASFSYLDRLLNAGVKLCRSREGFMHQKVLLVDEEICSVGTANLDNRSLRLNFEITLLYRSRGFADKVAQMLMRDFEAAEPVPPDEYEQRGLMFRVSVSAARLFAPIL